MLLIWFFAARGPAQAQLKQSIPSIKSSISFAGSQLANPSALVVPRSGTKDTHLQQYAMFAYSAHPLMGVSLGSLYGFCMFFFLILLCCMGFSSRFVVWFCGCSCVFLVGVTPSDQVVVFFVCGLFPLLMISLSDLSTFIKKHTHKQQQQQQIPSSHL